MNNAVADPLFYATRKPATSKQIKTAVQVTTSKQQAINEHKRQRQYPLVLVVRSGHFKNEYVHCFRSSR